MGHAVPTPNRRCFLEICRRGQAKVLMLLALHEVGGNCVSAMIASVTLVKRNRLVMLCWAGFIAVILFVMSFALRGTPRDELLV